jgi:hypothetical protein
VLLLSQREVFQLYRGGQSKGGISGISWWSIKGRYFSYIVAVSQREVFQVYCGSQSKGGISVISDCQDITEIPPFD